MARLACRSARSCLQSAYNTAEKSYSESSWTWQGTFASLQSAEHVRKAEHHSKNRVLGSSWIGRPLHSLKAQELTQDHALNRCWKIRVSSGVVSKSAATNGAAVPEVPALVGNLGQDGDLDEDWETAWTHQDAAELYRVEGWGSPYFSINARGNVAIRPKGSEDGVYLLSCPYFDFFSSIRVISHE
jgi:hypothetical protein